MESSMKSTIIIVSILMTALLLPESQATELREIYLVRHAEKQADGTKDPSLTKAGEQRALNLVERLKTKNIRVIYSTDYKRTMETARPLSKATALEIQKYNPGDLAAFAKQLKSETGNTLVVGHSNTTPELASLLSGQKQVPMDETIYDGLYIVQIEKDKVLVQYLQWP